MKLQASLRINCEFCRSMFARFRSVEGAGLFAFASADFVLCVGRDMCRRLQRCCIDLASDRCTNGGLGRLSRHVFGGVLSAVQLFSLRMLQPVLGCRLRPSRAKLFIWASQIARTKRAASHRMVAPGVSIAVSATVRADGLQ